MKSKTLFSRYIWGAIRRDAWMFVVSLLAMFLALPVKALMDIDRWYKQISQGMKMWEAQQNFSGIVGFSNSPLLYVTFILAVILGVTGFSFLHNARQIDFYYSQPMKRSFFFRNKTVVAMLAYAVPYVLNLLLTMLVGIARGVNTSRAFSMAGLGFFYNLLLFYLIYMLAVIAMELTGRIFVGVLGVACFMCYGWGIAYILNQYVIQHFVTYNEKSFQWIEWILNFSPIYAGANTADRFTAYFTGQSIEIGRLAGPYLLMIFVCVLLTVLACVLHKKRRAESAGHSMAFSKAGVILRFVIVIPGALLIGAFAETITYKAQFVWLICGIVFGVLLINGVMESIYHMDFKRVFAHKIQIVCMLGAAVLIACVFQFDLFHYDTYLPKQDQIEDISLGIDYNQYGADIYENGAFVTEQDYMMERTRLGDDDMVYEMLEKIVAAQKTETSEEDRMWKKSLKVCYRLSNGKKVYRTYQTDVAAMQETFSHIYDMPGVKEASFPVLSVNPDLIQDMQLNYLSESQQIGTEQSTDRAEILEAYQQDLMEMSGEQLTTHAPVASLDLTYGENPYSSTAHCLLYADNKHTIALLQEKGYTIDAQLDPAQVSTIQIDDYRNDSTYTDEITDPDKIKETLPKLVYSDNLSIWQTCADDLYVTLSVRRVEGYTIRTGCQFKAGEEPDTK